MLINAYSRLLMLILVYPVSLRRPCQKILNGMVLTSITICDNVGILLDDYF